MPDLSEIAMTDPQLARDMAQLQLLRERKNNLKNMIKSLTQEPGDDLILKECTRLMGFVREAWHIVEPKRQIFKDGWAVCSIADHLEAVTREEIHDLLINVPPGFMKSLMTKVFWPAWEWGPMNKPWMTYVTASYSKGLSLRDARKLKRLISSDWYQRLWPHVKIPRDRSAISNFGTTQKGFYLGTSVGGLGTGERAYRFITDDANNVKDAESDAIRESTNDWRDEVVPTRVNDAEVSAFIDIQQRTHERDTSGMILKNPPDGLVHLQIQMEYDPKARVDTPYFKDPRTVEGELAWPERFDQKAVDKLKKKIGKYASSAQLQQKPTPRGGGIIERKMWKIWNDESAKKVGCHANEFPEMEFVIFSLDGAYTEKQENDPSGFTIWGVWRHPDTRQPQVMLMYAWRERLEFNDLIERTRKDSKRYRVNRGLIEGKAVGHSVHQELRRKLVGDFGVELVQPFADKVARTYAVQHLFEEGMIWAPERTWAEMVIDEVSAMSPFGSLAEHDDLTDSTTQALNWLRQNGFALTKEEGTGERTLFGKELQDLNKPLYDV